jgi:hypothetical protein
MSRGEAGHPSKIGLVALLLVGALAGYLGSRGELGLAPRSIDEEEGQAPGEKRPTSLSDPEQRLEKTGQRALVPDTGFVVTVGRQPASAAPAVPLEGRFGALAKARGLESKGSAMNAAFAGGVAGARVARLATFFEFDSASDGAESKLFHEQLDWITEHPEAAFQAIRDGLPRLGEEHSPERRYLVQLVAKLDAPEAAKLELLAGEISRPLSGERIYDGAAALSALMQVSRDPSELETTVRRGLRAQEDPRARELLLSLYSAREPERGRRLARELGSD